MTSEQVRPVCLLTGGPGVGKTTIIKEALTRMELRGGGFYSEEIREGGVRQGFRIVTLGGRSAVLAHVNAAGPYRVGNYAVNLEGLEGTGVAALKSAIEQSALVVIDEVGKMELFSAAFRVAVEEALGKDKRVLGSIMLHPHPWADSIKRNPRVFLLTVTRDNRAQVLEDVMLWARGVGL